MSLDVRDLGFAYSGGAPVLRDVGFTLVPGRRLAVIGANGSGKSSLARCLAGWEETGDAVRWRGRPWAAFTAAERVAAVQLVGQRPDINLSGRAETLRREAAFGPENLARPRQLIAAAADAALARMGLAGLAGRSCGTLSGGEVQRLALAAALAVGPELLVLDEPVTDLDAAARAAFAEHLLALGPGVSIVCFDVALRPWMAGFFDEIRTLDAGRLSASLSAGAFPQSDPAPPRLAPGAVSVSVRGLRFAHPGGGELFGGSGFDLPAGATVAVVGPNGAGKSTLMRLLAGLARPAAGTIEVAGLDPAETPARALAAVVGMVFQNADRQFLTARVLDETAFGPRLHGMPDPEGLARAAIEAVGLSDRAEAHPFDLDNGARRLAAAAAAAAHRPQVLILDETQRGLDAANTARLEGLLAGERDRGAVTLVVCHDSDFVARNATHHIQVDGGRITLSGPALR